MIKEPNKKYLNMSKFYNVKNLVDFDEVLINELKDIKNKHFEFMGNWVFINGKKIFKIYISRNGSFKNNILNTTFEIHNILNPNSTMTKQEIEEIIKL